MEVEGTADPKRINPRHGVAQTYAYLKTQADTASINITITTPASDPPTSDPMLASGVWLDTTDTSHQHLHPICDLVALMQPLWSAPIVIDEPVLPWRVGAGPAGGDLLLPPAEVLTVRSADQRITYLPDVDYRCIGRSLIRLPGSRMPELHVEDLLTGECAWNGQLEQHQVTVTYRPARTWQGPVPTDQRDRLLRTTARLRHGLPLRIVTIGDSITNGSQTSGHRQAEPFMPGWPELFTGELRRRFRHDQVVLSNTALGGATSAWGAVQAACAVAPLQPDLVIIAFGMNDFWTIEAPSHRRNLESIMEAVRVINPLAEFVLVTSMAFDPAYTSSKRYHRRLRDYATEAQVLGGAGVAILDLYTLSKALYAAKKPKDCLADPLHPNDYLARWYAQGLVQVVAGTDQASAPRVSQP